MLNQMKHFDVQSAECTVESDRAVIQEQMMNLFDVALEPPVQVPFGTVADAPDAPLMSPELDQFNAYVRGPLRESVEASIGKEDYIPLNSCIAAVLPMVLAGFVITLSCDGRSDCELSASYWGYASVTEYMLGSAFVTGVQVPLLWVLIFPLVLQTTSLVARAFPSGIWQTLLGASLTGLVIAACLFGASLQCGLFLVVIIKYSPVWLGVLVVSFAIDFCIFWFCFCRNPSRSPSFAVSTSRP